MTYWQPFIQTSSWSVEIEFVLSEAWSATLFNVDDDISKSPDLKSSWLSAVSSIIFSRISFTSSTSIPSFKLSDCKNTDKNVKINFRAYWRGNKKNNNPEETNMKYQFLTQRWIFSLIIHNLYSFQQSLNLSWLWLSCWGSYKKQEMLSLLCHLGSSMVFSGVHDAHLFNFLCCVFFVCLFVFVLCCVPFVERVSEWPLFIVPSVFSCFYLKSLKYQIVVKWFKLGSQFYY